MFSITFCFDSLQLLMFLLQGTGTNGVLTGGPQLVLASSQGQGLTTFPTVTTQQAATLHQHTSIQQVLHQHVQHSNILHSTSIRQVNVI